MAKKKAKKNRKPRKSYSERLEAAVQRTEQRLAQKLTRAGDWPVKYCLINSGWEDHRLASIIIVRERTDGALAGAIFLVDVGCLGIKSVDVRASLSWGEANQMRRAVEGPEGDLGEAIEPCDALKIIETGAAYGESLGFEPAGGSNLALMMFRGINAGDSSLEVECGADGKPLYVRGPDDNWEAIVAHLTERFGLDGFESSLEAM